MPDGLLQHQFSHLGAASKKDVVKTLFQQRLVFRPASGDYLHMAFIKDF